MRVMGQHFGVVLLEDTEVIFRVYETTDQEWKLLHYHSSLLPEGQPLKTDNVLEIIGEFLSTEHAQYIEEWKICSRHYPKKIAQDISRALNIPVEAISLHREQELLCKGMFTELW
jgi:hypothetical protein